MCCRIVGGHRKPYPWSSMARGLYIMYVSCDRNVKNHGAPPLFLVRTYNAFKHVGDKHPAFVVFNESLNYTAYSDHSPK